MEPRLKKGKAYYIGNIASGSGTSTSGMSVQLSWDLKHWRNDFAQDSKRLSTSYHNFADIEKINPLKYD